MNLQSACWPELPVGADVALFPLGSCEQHGPHLPFGTDALIADAVARRAAAELNGAGVQACCAPVLPFGASGEHQHFGGTVSIGHQALHDVIVEIGRSATTWAQRLVFVNGHGGNLPTLSLAVRQLRTEGRDAAWVAGQPAGADAHAGHTETSLMLAIAPELVRLDVARAGVTEPLGELLPRLRRGGVIAVSPNGVLGDPTGADAEAGEALLGRLVATVVDAIRAGSADDAGRLLVPA